MCRGVPAWWSAAGAVAAGGIHQKRARRRPEMMESQAGRGLAASRGGIWWRGLSVFPLYGRPAYPGKTAPHTGEGMRVCHAKRRKAKRRAASRRLRAARDTSRNVHYVHSNGAGNYCSGLPLNRGAKAHKTRAFRWPELAGRDFAQCQNTKRRMARAHRVWREVSRATGKKSHLTLRGECHGRRAGGAGHRADRGVGTLSNLHGAPMVATCRILREMRGT